MQDLNSWNQIILYFILLYFSLFAQLKIVIYTKTLFIMLPKFSSFNEKSKSSKP
jgi:hypothetical protein